MYEVVKSWLPWSMFLLFLASCASPVAPVGRPLVKTPPKIIKTSPKVGQLNVRTSVVEVTFDRYMNRNALRNQLQFEPDLGIEYTTRWKRKSLFIAFNRPLPESITVIMTLGAQLADMDGNTLGAPYRLGFSTGNRLDSAKVSVTVRSFSTGKAEAGKQLGLFRVVEPLEPAIYVNQTDTSGRATFSYIREGYYEVFLFEDRNRNRTIDTDEYAQRGFEQVYISQQQQVQLPEIIYYKPDTLAPSLLGVGLLSSQRLRVRFSEPIRLSDRSQLAVLDSLSNRIKADWLYTDPDNPSVAFAHTYTPLAANQRYTIAIGALEDLAGNKVETKSDRFKGFAQKDTSRLRLLRIQAPAVVSPQDSIMVLYTGVLDQQAMVDSLLLVEGDRLLRNYSGVVQKANRLYVYDPKGWSSGQNYQLRAWDPYQQKHQSLSFRPLDPTNVGSLEVKFPEQWQNRSIIIELLDPNSQVIKRIATHTNITLSDLIPGEYYLRTWVDVNNNGRWDPGQWKIGKQAKGEPVYLRPALPISSRMTSTMEVILEAD